MEKRQLNLATARVYPNEGTISGEVFEISAASTVTPTRARFDAVHKEFTNEVDVESINDP
jgi:hypothetical protein